MSRHEWMEQKGDQPQDPNMPKAGREDVGRKPRSASSGFVVRSALRAGESDGTTSLLEKVQQWLQNLTGSSM